MSGSASPAQRMKVQGYMICVMLPYWIGSPLEMHSTIQIGERDCSLDCATAQLIFFGILQPMDSAYMGEKRDKSRAVLRSRILLMIKESACGNESLPRCRRRRFSTGQMPLNRFSDASCLSHPYKYDMHLNPQDDHSSKLLTYHFDASCLMIPAATRQ